MRRTAGPSLMAKIRVIVAAHASIRHASAARSPRPRCRVGVTRGARGRISRRHGIRTGSARSSRRTQATRKGAEPDPRTSGPRDLSQQPEEPSLPFRADAPVHGHALVALVESLSLHTEVEVTPRGVLAYGGREIVARPV